MKKIILVFLLLLGNTAFAQLYYKNYDWDKNPSYHQISKEESTKDIIVLKLKLTLEYAYEDNELVEYRTVHKILRINSAAKVSAYNKLYIPSIGVVDFLSVKARTISPDGKVSVTNSRNLKEADDVDNSGSYKMLPIEDLKEGYEEEFIYTLKETPDIYTMYYFQDEIYKKDMTYEIFSPSNLKFEFKSYNGLPQASYDTLTKGKRHALIHVDTIPGIKEEKYMAYRANCKKALFQLAYNYSRNNARLFTYDLAAEKYFKMYTEAVKGEESAIKSIIKAAKVKDLKGEAQIKALELYLKKNINTSNDVTPENNTVDKIFKTKLCTAPGLFRLTCLVLDALNVPYQIVITSDRMVDPLDPEFNSWYYLKNTALYFPDLDDYMSPSLFYTRLGYLPYELVGQTGIFIKIVDVGGFKSGISRLKNIPAPAMEKSIHAQYAMVDLTKTGNESTVHIKNELSGYSAMFTQPVYEYLKGEKQTELIDNYTKVTGNDGVVSNLKIQNGTMDDALIKPMVIECDLKDENLIEHAGDKLLVKAGLLIGRQEEMYEDSIHKFPVQIQFKHQYVRKIEIKIPDGYMIANPEVCKIMQTCKMQDGTMLADFVSSYSQEGNLFTISCTEKYNALEYPNQLYDSYRKVVNAAADFNKITLIIKKK